MVTGKELVSLLSSYINSDKIPYSGKFSQDRNFRKFHDPTSARKNFFLQKFFADELKTSTTVCLRVTVSMRENVGGVVRYHDLVTKIKIAKNFFLACLLVIRENLCSRKFPAIQYTLPRWFLPKLLICSFSLSWLGRSDSRWGTCRRSMHKHCLANTTHRYQGYTSVPMQRYVYKIYQIYVV